MKGFLQMSCFLLTFICFWVCLAFAVRTVQLRKPGLPLFPSWLESPFNHPLSSTHLSEAGLRARRKCFGFGIASIAFTALYLLIGA